MKDIAIFYFSGTGNTWYASKKLENYFIQSGVDAKSYSVDTLNERESNNIVSKSDLVVLGYPIYASNIPAPMVKFIQGLKDHPDKMSAIFCTQMMFSGDGARVCDSLIQKKGFKTKWAIHINMPNNLNCGSFSFLPITNDEKKLSKMRDKIDKRIKKFSNYIINDVEFKQGFSSASQLMAKVQRPDDKAEVNSYWKNSMSIDKDSCVKCGKCAKLCPMGNILKDENGYYTNGNCCGCLRCHNFCPLKAIKFNGKKSEKDCYRGPIKGFSPNELIKKR